MNEKIKGHIAIFEGTTRDFLRQIYSEQEINDFLNRTRTEMAAFACYLSASDGEIKWEEAKTISEIFDIPLSPQEIATWIRENNIYSRDFERRPPIIIDFAVNVENNRFQQGLAPEKQKFHELIIALYGEIAGAVLKSDGDVADQEQADLETYLGMMYKYAKDNLLYYRQSVTGFKKDIGSVPAPKKKM